MKPPKSFVTALANLDPELGLRYSGRMGMWIIERRARMMPATEIPLLENRVRRLRSIAQNDFHPQQKMARKMLVRTEEELVSAKTNKYAIMFTKHLTPRAYDILCMQDIQRNGGFAEVARKLQEEEERVEKDRERMNDNEMHALNLETYDILNFLWRKRETQLLHGERDLQKMLHGKRTDPRAKREPLVKIALA